MAEYHINIDLLTDYFHNNDHRFDDLIRQAKIQLQDGNAVIIDKQTAGIMPNVVKRIENPEELNDWVKFNYPSDN